MLDSDPNKSAIAILTGSAGTGKTTVVSELISRINSHMPPPYVVLCATTHRAATVLSDIVGADVQTGHAAFKLRPSVTKYGGENTQALPA